MGVIELSPEENQWVIRFQDERPMAAFPTFDQAERRARWVAVRQAVRGLGVEIRILDAQGVVVGRWIDEGYVPALAPVRRAA